MLSPTPHHPRQSPVASGRSGWRIPGIGVGLAFILLAAVGLPVVGVAMQLVRGLGEPSSAPTSETPVFVGVSLWNTAIYTILIGMLATGLGLPAAWVMRRERAWWTALLVVPLLMPSYLAYAGWGLMRGPGSWLGDWLAHGSPARSLVFDKVLAVGGLAMWAWPMGAFIVGPPDLAAPVKEWVWGGGLIAFDLENHLLVFAFFPRFLLLLVVVVGLAFPLLLLLVVGGLGFIGGHFITAQTV